MQRKYKQLPKRESGRTNWFPRNQHPVRPGIYECIAWHTSSAPSMILKLEWDGDGFLTPWPWPTVVDYWRGLTKQAALVASTKQETHRD